jgi:hypothetical protein
MRKAKILYKDEEAGVLTQHDDGSFTFNYNDTLDWLITASLILVLLCLKLKKNFIQIFISILL